MGVREVGAGEPLGGSPNSLGSRRNEAKVAMNARERREGALEVVADDAVVAGAHDVVALAGFGFKAGAVDDADAAPGVIDEAFSLQLTGGYGDGGTAGAEHLGEELLSELESLRLSTVGGGEEPAGHALLDRVKAVAEDRLGHLHDLHVQEGVDELGKGATSEKLVPEGSEADAHAGSGTLHDDGVAHHGLAE